MQAWGWVVPTPTKGEPGTAGPSQPVPPHGTSTDGARGGGGTAHTSPGSVGCHRAPVPHLGWHQGAWRGTLGSHMEELEGAQTMCRISCAPTRVPCCPLWGPCGVQQCKEPSSIPAWSALPRRVPIPAAPAGETGLISGCTPRYHSVDPPSGPFRGPHHRDRDDQGVGTTRPIPPLPLAPLGECFQPLSLTPFVFYGIFGWRSFMWQRGRTLKAVFPGVPQFPSRPRTCAGSAARPRQDVQSRPGSSATPCRRAAKIMNKLLLINTL